MHIQSDFTGNSRFRIWSKHFMQKAWQKKETIWNSCLQNLKEQVWQRPLIHTDQNSSMIIPVKRVLILLQKHWEPIIRIIVTQRPRLKICSPQSGKHVRWEDFSQPGISMPILSSVEERPGGISSIQHLLPDISWTTGWDMKIQMQTQIPAHGQREWTMQRSYLTLML